jgi:uncharacterized protein (DUF433 family)
MNFNSSSFRFEDHPAGGALDTSPASALASGEMSSRLSRITIDPEVCHGKPVIRGLRYPVESILEYLAGGDSLEDVLAEFPDLEREDLLACLEFAQRSLQLKSQHLALA